MNNLGSQFIFPLRQRQNSPPPPSSPSSLQALWSSKGWMRPPLTGAGYPVSTEISLIERYGTKGAGPNALFPCRSGVTRTELRLGFPLHNCFLISPPLLRAVRKLNNTQRLPPAPVSSPSRTALYMREAL